MIRRTSPFADWIKLAAEFHGPQLAEKTALAAAFATVDLRCVNPPGALANIGNLVEILDRLHPDAHTMPKVRAFAEKRLKTFLHAALAAGPTLDGGQAVDCWPDTPPRHWIRWGKSIVLAGWVDRYTVDSIKDWIAGTNPTLAQLESISFRQATEASDAWHRELKRQRQMQPPPPADKVIHRWPDGYTLYELTTAEELDAEGSHMGHCVSGATHLLNPCIQILSLRDSKGRGKITLEFEHPGYGPAWLVQAQGPGNDQPSLRHAIRLADYLLSPDAKMPPCKYDAGEHGLTLAINAIEVATAVQKKGVALLGQDVVHLAPRGPGKRPYLVWRGLLAGDLASADAWRAIRTKQGRDRRYPWFHRDTPPLKRVRLAEREGLITLTPMKHQVLPPTRAEVATWIAKRVLEHRKARQ